MIHPQELRIGNKLFIPGLDVVVTVIAIFRTHFRCEGLGGIQYDESFRINFKPIRLTGERLIKYGFTQGDNTRTNDSFYEILVGGSYLAVNPDNGVVWIIKGSNVFNNPALIQYEHQLQNLVYSLSSSELTIKE